MAELENKKSDNKNQENESKDKKIEVCFTCGKEFDMNCDEGAHYHYDKYPMCGYCTNFFGFYGEDMMDNKTSND